MFSDQYFEFNNNNNNNNKRKEEKKKKNTQSVHFFITGFRLL